MGVKFCQNAKNKNSILYKYSDFSGKKVARFWEERLECFHYIWILILVW
jgi:hypothetical protein